MRLIRKARKATVRDEIANAERAAKAIRDKLDRLDEGFLAWSPQRATRSVLRIDRELSCKR